MKTHRHLITLLVSATLFAGAASAHPGGHGEDIPAVPKPRIPAKPAPALPATSAETIAAIQRRLDALKTALKDGKLSAVRSNAVTLNELVRHIANLLPADHQANVKEIVERQSKLTEELARAAAAGAQKEVDSLVTKISGNIRALNAVAH